ncbi:hypothetical protein E2C01_015886 [Portunus trituberculatus]|uniref:Uncharacterized protein n=1 Tax=Portunus trituberculatus TaxID=210409 RepID=A0A5B7DN13_PORTR|nr:hypothetical protein [Portunus trituberculatus]
MSIPAFGCPFCSAIFAEEDQMLCHFLQESNTVQVEVGDDPSNPQVIAPDGTTGTNKKAVKEEIIIDCPDEDVLCDDSMKVHKYPLQCN